MCRAMLAGALLLAAGGAAGQSCTFGNQAPAGVLFSPALDPSAAVPRTATTDLQVQCFFVTPAWSFSGSNGSSPLRMRHQSLSAFIPYTVSPSRVSGIIFQRWRLTVSVQGADYQNAPAGTYSDILTATVFP
jgi:hypothetical protein